MSDVVGEIETWSVGGTIESVDDLEKLDWIPPLEDLDDRSRTAAEFAVGVLRDAAGAGLLEGRHDVRLYGHASSGLSISAWPRAAVEDEVVSEPETEPEIYEDGVRVSPPEEPATA